MKKIIFFALIALILSACQPASEGTTSQTQVTATSTAPVTETPAATTETAETAETATANDGAGAWVEAMTPEKMWGEEVKEWGLNVADYSERKDVDGNLSVVKKSTGEVVYWVDENGVGYWNLQVMRKMIVETKQEDKVCYPTRWVGTKGQSIPPKIDAESYDRNFAKPFSEKFKQKILELGIMKDYPLGFKDFLGGNDNCWASTRIKKVGQIPDELETNYIFWLNSDKALQYEQVFSPSVKKIVLADA